MRINPQEAVTQIVMCFQAKLVPFLTGSPGIGKSHIFLQIAKKYKLKVIDLRLSQCDPTDLNGFPRIKGEKAGYAPMDTFPLEGDGLPKSCKGWLLLLDEINSAALAVQAASYKLTLDRMIGQYNLHPYVVIGCAGNLATDRAIVNRVGTAMQTRLIHLEMMVDHKTWSLWASGAGLATEVISYINHRPNHLHDFDPEHNDKTFACPRTWEFSSRIVQYNPTVMTLRDKLPALAGAVSEGKAIEFVNYCDVYKHIATYKDIIIDPRGIAIPSEPSMLAALSGAVGSNMTVNDVPKAMQYVRRLPTEFQIFALRDALKRTPAIAQEKEVLEWVTEYADELSLF
jgi:hypothetical protein